MIDRKKIHVSFQKRSGKGSVKYLMVIGVFAGLTILVLMLYENIIERKVEGKQHVFQVVDLNEQTENPAEWGKNFPLQYDSFRRSVDIERTRHGGSEAFQKLDQDPHWRRLFSGYAFSIDYREDRGHAYMLSDQDITERVTHFKQPGACLHCHSSILPAYRQAGAGDLMKGFEIVCAMPYEQARKMVSHPVSCLDCHDPQSMQLRVTRPGFLNGIQELAKSTAKMRHLPSIERWRKQGQREKYDPNTMASRHEMRTMVCAQCHVEYYFKSPSKLLAYPWSNGVKVEQIENYYEEIGFKDWTHSETGAPLLKAQHPEFELWSQGIHAQSGVSCSDCHMPYQRVGAVKISDHQVRSPLLNISRSCQTCHRYSEAELLSRSEIIQNRTRSLMLQTEKAVLDLIEEIKKGKAAGLKENQLDTGRKFHRKAQWYLDFVAAENSMGFHASQESARILGEAINFARQGQIEVLRQGQKKK